MLVTCTREQGAHFDGTMFRVAGTAHRRSCSALWTSWGEMWVEAVKKCYLSTWVPFPSFFFSSAKINFLKKKSVQAIKACWLGSCFTPCTHGLNWGAECLLEKQGLLVGVESHPCQHHHVLKWFFCSTLKNPAWFCCFCLCVLHKLVRRGRAQGRTELALLQLCGEV